MPCSNHYRHDRRCVACVTIRESHKQTAALRSATEPSSPLVAIVGWLVAAALVVAVVSFVIHRAELVILIAVLVVVVVGLRMRRRG